MAHLYFFVSSVEHDTVNNITVVTGNVKRAISMAKSYFRQYAAKGEPQLLAL